MAMELSESLIRGIRKSVQILLNYVLCKTNLQIVEISLFVLRFFKWLHLIFFNLKNTEFRLNFPHSAVKRQSNFILELRDL